jgi:hypothetical protein
MGAIGIQREHIVRHGRYGNISCGHGICGWRHIFLPGFSLPLAPGNKKNISVLFRMISLF